jgi:hydrogenase 3 maturation protease
MRETIVKALEEMTSSTDRKTMKISVLGVGSELRGDDAVGLLIAENLTKKCEEDKCGLSTKLQVLYGATAPENFTGEIKKFAPTHLIIIDAAEMGEKPGSIRVIKKDEIKGVTFSTHVLPLSVMVDYLSNSFKFETVVIGVEPKDMGFDHPVSNEINIAVSAVTDAIYTFSKKIV